MNPHFDIFAKLLRLESVSLDVFGHGFIGTQKCLVEDLPVIKMWRLKSLKDEVSLLKLR